MRAAGLDPEADDDDYLVRPYIPAFLLAGLLTGVVPHPNALTGEILSAQIEPWFCATAPSSAHGPTDPAMNAALEAAPPHLLRAVIAGETMRLAAVLDLTDTPGLTEAIAPAERGEPVIVLPAPNSARTSAPGWTTPAGQPEHSTTGPLTPG
ncbi:hypothetical protein [Actinomadura oligospora]|uniref:hypothetical protein n=1 Tax=Actinomadura oligospora TaxID=111804 RepID=UPI00047B413A|nr:hypothetical protein [Actinomadura oligospora]